jgi:hypothetical protein
MKPPPWMRITLGRTNPERTAIEATVTITYCPCGWRCHAEQNPCSLSCLAHDERTTPAPSDRTGDDQ